MSQNRDMRKLYEDESRYYISRALKEPVDYEKSYWGTITDPDGCVRDRQQERQQHIDDLYDEINYVKHQTPGRILDVGCGLGFFLSSLSDKWEKHGVEISKFATEEAKRWGHVYCGDLTDAGYPDEFFDIVMMHHVIEHIEQPERLITDVSRVLKVGGKLILGTPDFDSGAARRFGDNYRLLCDATHVSLFSSDSMHRFLRDYGFKIEYVEYPFFKSRHFTEQNLLRMFDTSQVSPPFYGSFMTFYAHKKGVSK